MVGIGHGHAVDIEKKNNFKITLRHNCEHNGVFLFDHYKGKRVDGFGEILYFLEHSSYTSVNCNDQLNIIHINGVPIQRFLLTFSFEHQF